MDDRRWKAVSLCPRAAVIRGMSMVYNVAIPVENDVIMV
jgi:hypothetical protein